MNKYRAVVPDEQRTIKVFFHAKSTDEALAVMHRIGASALGKLIYQERIGRQLVTRYEHIAGAILV